MIHQDGDIKWYESLDESKEDGYVPVKCTSILQFYTLKGKTSKITTANIEGIRYVHYVVKGSDGKFYFRLWRNLPLDYYWFYRPTLTFSGEDEAVSNLRRYVEDGTVTILYTQQQVEDVIELLKRVFKGQYTGEGKVPYPIFIELMAQIIDYEDYQNKLKNAVGYRTVCKGYEDKIAALWAKALEKGRTV